jgi:hypothetical protein
MMCAFYNVAPRYGLLSYDELIGYPLESFPANCSNNSMKAFERSLLS